MIHQRFILTLILLQASQAYAIFGVTSTSAPQSLDHPSASIGQGGQFGRLGFQGYGYTSPILQNGGQFQSIFFATTASEGQWESGIDYSLGLQGILSRQSQANSVGFWWEAPQAAIGYKGLWVGRKIFSWSETDDYWGIGLWQPRNRWDYLQVTPVGLSGSFYQYQSDDRSFQITTYFSPIYVPERGPTIALREGLFYPSNPWPGSPPSSVPVSSRDANIVYQIAMPPLHTLVLNPGGAIQLKAVSNNGLFGSLAYAYKPINQVQIGYDGILNLSTFNADATIYPRISYHHLATLEGGFKRNQLAIWSSLTVERPMDQSVAANVTTPRLVPSTLFSSTAKFPLPGSLSRRNTLEMSYLKRFGEASSDRGPWASTGRSVFEPRFNFEDAIAVGYRGTLPGVSANWLSVQTRWVESIQSNGSLLSTELVIRPSARWSWVLGADIMGAPDAATDTSSASGVPSNDFISRYKGYDRIYGGIHVNL